MKIVTCASYYGTGSSAVTDYLKEFDNVYCPGDYEFRFIQDPDGISDLEFKIVENYNRHNSGHALKKYKKLVDFLSGGRIVKKYEAFFGGNFKKLSYEYIENLTDYKFNGYWHEDVRERGNFFYFRKRFLNKLMQKTVFKLQGKNERSINELPHEITLGCYKTEEEFLIATKMYVSSLMNCLNKDNKEVLMVDQLLPPNNLKRYVRYFDDIKVLVVDRDPRDVYLLEKIRWKGTITPRDVETFCKWYKVTRQHRDYEDLNTRYSKLIQFEDLIYNYEDTTRKIKDFLGFNESSHLNIKKFFNPEISINNTLLYKKNTEYQDDIKYIEKNLMRYLYII